jgi:cell division septal protein FtsQ
VDDAVELRGPVHRLVDRTPTDQRSVVTTASHRGTRPIFFAAGRWLGLAVRRLPRLPPLPESMRGLVLGAIAALTAIVLVFGASQLWQLVYHHSDQFRIRELQIAGSARVDPEDLKARWASLLGQHRGVLDEEGIERSIAHDPWVSEASVGQLRGGVVLIRVYEHSPRLLLAHPDDGELWVVDDMGRPFKALEPTDQLDLPVITGFDGARLRDDPQGAELLLQRAGHALDALDGGGFDTGGISELRIATHGGVVLVLRGGSQVDMGAEDFSTRAERLVRLTQTGQVDLSVACRVGLNFSDQVVVRPLEDA